MQQITSLIQHTCIERLADILGRHLTLQIGLISADFQLLNVGKTVGFCAGDLPKQEVWKAWFGNPKAQLKPFLNDERSSNLRIMAVPVHEGETCRYAIFAAVDAQNNGLIHSGFVIEMLMEMATQLEMQLKLMPQLKQKTEIRQGNSCEPFGDIIANSVCMKPVLQWMADVCKSDVPLWIEGGLGTGKKHLARLIHQNSLRQSGPFLIQNCAVLSNTELEAELFGHKRGIVSGALMDKTGLLEIAHSGTFVLEDVDALSPDLQLKLLRVLKTMTFAPLGDSVLRSVNVRFIATSQNSLNERVKSGAFNEELYYHFRSFAMHLPSLKERDEDFLPLCEHFIAQNCALNRCQRKTLSSEAAEILRWYNWPGNILELKHEMQRLVVLTHGSEVVSSDGISPRILQAYAEGQKADQISNHMREAVAETTQSSEFLKDFSLLSGQTLQSALEEIEKRLITWALAQNNGNRTKTAEVLGISRRNLIRKIENMQIEG